MVNVENGKKNCMRIARKKIIPFGCVAKREGAGPLEKKKIVSQTVRRLIVRRCRRQTKAVDILLDG